jgi:hypothetical protein
MELLDSRFVRFSGFADGSDPKSEAIRIYDEAFVCLHNQRLKEAKDKDIPILCKVYQLDDPVPSHMDGTMTVVWQDHVLHRLTLRANTMAGVMISRCASVNSTFSKNGEHYLKRIDFPTKKISAATFTPCVFEGVTAPLYIQSGGAFHERNDLEAVIFGSDLFQCERYEKCMNARLQ